MPGPIPVTTDLATLVAFDPDLLKHRVRVKNDWWRTEKVTALPEVAGGKIAVLPIGDEGTFRVSLREGGLEEAERARAKGKIEGLGLEVVSGRLFVGAAERLPGDGQDQPGEIPGTGALWSLEPGRYALTVWALGWRDEAAFFDEDNEPLPAAPSDFVLVVAPTAEPPDVPFELPSLLDLLPKREAKGGTHVPKHVVKRRSEPEPAPRRRSSSSERTTRDGPRPRPLAATAPVPEERAPLTEERVAATFREVLAESWLHPPQRLDVEAIVMRPHDRTLVTHEVKTDLLLEKVTRVRENMRVFEAKVNADERLPTEDIIALETRITGVYAALEDLIALVARPRP
jgi:hypothetical protein